MFHENAILFKSKRYTGGLGVIDFKCNLIETIEIVRELVKIGQENSHAHIQNVLFSVEFALNQRNQKTSVNLFTENKSVEETNVQLEKGLSLIMQGCHQISHTIDVKRLSGKELKSHYYGVLGGKIHDFDIDRGEVLILNDDGERYASLSGIGKRIATLSDFEYILQNLVKIHEKRNDEMSFIFPFRFKGKNRIETSPYIIQRSKSRNNLFLFRKDLVSTFSKPKRSKKGISIRDISGRNFVRNLGLILTRGIMTPKYTRSTEDWLLRCNIINQSDNIPQTQNLQTPIHRCLKLTHLGQP
jgi:hypothetical protein